jgi:protein O-GlcNAc transferase
MLSDAEYAEMREAFERMPGGEFVRRAQAAAHTHADDARLWFVLGASHHRLGALEDALVAFERTLELQPDHIQAINAKAGLLAALGRVEESRATLEEARKRFPGDATVLVNLGYLLEQQVEGLQEAVGCYDAALELEPSNAAALMNRGYLLTLLERLPEAVENNRKLVAHYPQLAAAHFNLAESLLAQGNFAESIEASSRAIEIDAGLLGARVTRIFARARAGQLDQVQQDLDRLHELDPHSVAELKRKLYGPGGDALDHVDARSIYLHLLYNSIQQCDWSRWQEFVDAFKTLVLQSAGSSREVRDATLPFLSLAFPIGREARLKLAEGVARMLREKAGARQSMPATEGSGRKIRIGYVSSDFRRHPGGYLMRNLFATHDRTRFEIFAYALDQDDGSDVRRDITSGCDVFRELAGLSIEAIVATIREDRIDIAIDRSGYLKLAKPEIFARGVAPLQVGYLGYAGTTGGDSLDYAIFDRVVCPEGDDRWWREKLVRLPYSYFVTNDRETVDSAPFSRMRLGLPEAATVFCCFNNAHKIDPQSFDVWMRILRRVPGSVLWLLETNAEMRKNLSREAQSRSVDPARLVFATFIENHAQHLGRYQFADVFLDTRHYNAHTTAIDALWCGLPVLTVPGDTNTARVAASLLHASGLPDLICQGWQEYEDKAVLFGCDAGVLRAQKAKVRESARTGHLFDTKGFAAALESGFEQMWRRHLAGLPPAAFDVPAPTGRSRD